MKILSALQIRELDAYTIKNEPISSIDLMERASMAFYNWFIKRYSIKKSVAIFCGMGNNGGDGLAIGRILHKKRYSVHIYVLYLGNASKDFTINENRLKKFLSIQYIRQSKDISLKVIPHIIIDALFGSGLNRKIQGLGAEAISYINKVRATRISIDIPSGLYCDLLPEGPAVQSHHTISFQFPKLSFFFPENEAYINRWHLVDIGLSQKGIENLHTSLFFLKKKEVCCFLKKRKKFTHKGTYGHALLVSGSFGKMGASVLAARSALRIGIGLLTCHIPSHGLKIMQTAVPEAMCTVDSQKKIISYVNLNSNYTACGIGPGIGKEIPTLKALENLLLKVKVPLILDADAINLLSENTNLLQKLPPGSILTPHPKEFERLAGIAKNHHERLQKQLDFAKKYMVFIILKGAYTSVVTPEGKTYFNSTGNSGMATAGSGDVLTGIITGLLAQGYIPEQATLLGVYLHGLAGDIALQEVSKESLIASDIINNISKSFLSSKKFY